MGEKRILDSESIYPKKNIVKKEGYTLIVVYKGIDRHKNYPIGSIELEGPDLKVVLKPVSLTGMPFIVSYVDAGTTSTLESVIVEKYNRQPDTNFLRELLREGLRPYMKISGLVKPENFW